MLLLSEETDLATHFIFSSCRLKYKAHFHCLMCSVLRNVFNQHTVVPYCPIHSLILLGWILALYGSKHDFLKFDMGKRWLISLFIWQQMTWFQSVSTSSAQKHILTHILTILLSLVESYIKDQYHNIWQKVIVCSGLCSGAFVWFKSARCNVL